MRPRFRSADWHDWVHRLPIEELLRLQDVPRFRERVRTLTENSLPDAGLLSRSERRALRSFLNLQADNIEGLSVKTRTRLYGIAALSGAGGLVGFVWSGVSIVAGFAAVVVIGCGIGAVAVGESSKELEGLLKDVARMFRRVAREL